MKKALIVFVKASVPRIDLRKIIRNRLIMPFLTRIDSPDTLQLINWLTSDIFRILKTYYDPNIRTHKDSLYHIYYDVANVPPWEKNEYGKFQANPLATIPDKTLSEEFTSACVPEIESQLNLVQIDPTAAYILHPDLHFDTIHYFFNPNPPFHSRNPELSRKVISSQIKTIIQEDLADAVAANKTAKQFIHPINICDSANNTLSTYREILRIINASVELHRRDTEYFVDMSHADFCIQQSFFAILQQAVIRGQQICMPHRKSIPWMSILDGTSVFSKEYFRPEISKEDPAEIWKIIQTRKPPKTDADIIRGGINTKNAEYRKLTEEITKVALNDESGTFLFLGETGVGKTEIVNHIMAVRKKRHMQRSKCVSENCATLDALTESTLFGSVKGGFTDAIDHHGRLAEADGGVLFLDEIGELTKPVQAKLLKAIEEKKFYRVGSNKEESSNFQLFCGTNHNLEDDVKNDLFRSDLLYRIGTWTFTLPPLRTRIKDDIEDLIDEWLNNPKRCTVNPRPYFEPRGRELFIKFATSPGTRWNGNFREFNRMLHKMAVRAEGSCITYEIVEAEIRESAYSDFLKSDASYRNLENRKDRSSFQEKITQHDQKSTSDTKSEHWNTHDTPLHASDTIDEVVINLIGKQRFQDLNGRDQSLLRGVIEVCGKARSRKEAEAMFYNSTSGALSRFLGKFGLHFSSKAASSHHLERLTPLCE